MKEKCTKHERKWGFLNESGDEKVKQMHFKTSQTYLYRHSVREKNPPSIVFEEGIS